MANYDQPAYVATSIPFDASVVAASYSLVPVTDPAWIAQRAAAVLAFNIYGGGGSSNPSGQDINGYGYSHSG